MAREVFWHIPGFCVNFYLNQIIINLMKEYPDKFREGYRIGSVYGTFPGAIWNGGRAVLGSITKQDMEKIISTYNATGTPVRFTWTNTLIEEKHVNDTYCNLIMKVADNGMNQVLCNSEPLEKYLRAEYPNFKFISSTTKRIKSVDSFKAELKGDYFMVVLDYDLNHDETVLKAVEEDAGRVEILVDEICYPNCPKRSEHYRTESFQQLEFDKGKPFACPNIKVSPSFQECMKRPAFISNDEIGSYIDRGFVNFKLVGRGLPEDLVKDSYLYFLVKDEGRDFISKKIDSTLASLRSRGR